MNKKRRILLTIFITLTLIAFIGIVYVNDYYRADSIVKQSLQGTETIEITTLDNKDIVFEPKNSSVGFIFYPGGKVEYTAYAPMMKALAQQGIFSVLVKMPGNLAVLDSDAADDIVNRYPEIKTWYIGGHSLGGAMAASYVSKHTKEFSGLVLLAAYSTADLSESELEVLTIYGSEDGVLNRKKLEQYAANLPEGARTCIIEGGCHAWFGYYGEQKNDGVATITREEQISQTVDEIVNLMNTSSFSVLE